MTMSSKPCRGQRIPVSNAKSKQKEMSELFGLTILASTLYTASFLIPRRESHWVSIPCVVQKAVLKNAHKSSPASQKGYGSCQGKGREGFLFLLPVKKI